VSISGISSVNWYAAGLARQNLPGNSVAMPGNGQSNGSVMAGASASSSASSSDDATTQFLNYMKETPAQRMQDAWLKQHGISPQAFAAMSGEEKQKIIDQMKQDIEAKLKQKLDSGNASTGTAKPSVDLTV
jgi:hypothetical protein